jgi:hypothetical protein
MGQIGPGGGGNAVSFGFVLPFLMEAVSDQQSAISSQRSAVSGQQSALGGRLAEGEMIRISKSAFYRS